MRHVVVEEWSRRGSALARREARVKLILVLFLLVLVAGAPPAVTLTYLILLAIAVGISKLPILEVLLRAGIVLPFSATFAAITYLNGDPARALNLVLRSYTSALAVLLLVSTTPQPVLLHGIQRLGVPRILVLVIQFLYRYLFLIFEQAHRMRMAAALRGGLRGRAGFSAAAGAVAVLFGRSYARAEGVQRAMLARGFNGHLPALETPSIRWQDLAFLVSGALIFGVTRWAAV